MTLFAVLLVITILSVGTAQRLAPRRGRRGWMMAAALLGPLPLVPLPGKRGR
jgi:hypothetical protein